MAALEQITDAQLTERVTGILRRELNVEEFARFLRLYRASTVDYTKERHKWLDGITVDDIVKELGILEDR
jgi:hypothetical protein